MPAPLCFYPASPSFLQVHVRQTLQGSSYEVTVEVQGAHLANPLNQEVALHW